MASSHSKKAKATDPEKTRTGARLRGPVLFIARAIWFAFALSFLVLFLLNLLAPLFGGKVGVMNPLSLRHGDAPGTPASADSSRFL